MNNNLSEEDVKFRYISPALEKAGWKKESIRMEYYFIDGQVFVKDSMVKRGEAKKADYLLLKDGKFQPAIV